MPCSRRRKTRCSPRLASAGAAALQPDADAVGMLDDPSTRKLAERLGTSHSAIAIRLRRYGIGGG